MGHTRTARVVYQVHSDAEEPVPADEVRAALQRHLVPLGHLQVELVDAQEHPRRWAELIPRPTAFVPTLPFDEYAALRRSRRIYRVEAMEAEPERLDYLRQALLVAGELAAQCEGVILDALALQVFDAERVARQLDQRFNPLDHVSRHAESHERPYWVHTHGLEKFGHPDFQLFGVPEDSLSVAERLLNHLTAAIVAGGSFRPRETTELCGFRFQFEPAPGRQPGCGSALTLARFTLLDQNESAFHPAMAGLLACQP